MPNSILSIFVNRRPNFYHSPNSIQSKLRFLHKWVIKIFIKHPDTLSSIIIQDKQRSRIVIINSTPYHFIDNNIFDTSIISLRYRQWMKEEWSSYFFLFKIIIKACKNIICNNIYLNCFYSRLFID